MANIKFVHTADIHIKSLVDEGFNALKEILEKAEENGAKALFITGDLFENEKHAFDVRTDVRELFESHPEIKVFMIPGNHDEEAYKKNINYGANVSILSDKPFEKIEPFEGIIIYSVPFHRNFDISSILKTILSISTKEDNFTILLSHGTLIDPWLKEILVYLSQYEKDTDSFYIHGDDLKESKIPLILLGHYHNFVEKNYEETTLTYSGSPIPTSIKNSGRRRASLIQIDTDKKRFEITEISLSSPFNIVETFKAIPGKEEFVLEEIEKFADKNQDKSAYLDLKIEGFISTDENKFQKRLDEISRKLKGKFKDVAIKNSSKLISSIRENPIVGQFLEIWEKEFSDEAKNAKSKEIYLKALEFALQAFEETILKKKS